MMNFKLKPESLALAESMMDSHWHSDSRAPSRSRRLRLGVAGLARPAAVGGPGSAGAGPPGRTQADSDSVPVPVADSESDLGSLALSGRVGACQ